MPHIWNLPIVRHKTTVVMNLKICVKPWLDFLHFDHKASEGEGLLDLLLKSGMDLLPIYRPTIHPVLEE